MLLYHERREVFVNESFFFFLSSVNCLTLRRLFDGFYTRVFSEPRFVQCIALLIMHRCVFPEK